MSDFYFNKQETLPVLSENIPMEKCPKKIGPYNVRSLFAKGGMSLLYLGTVEKRAKPLIIKVLPSQYAKDKEIVKRFLKEAEIISLSNHPNIIRLYGQGTWEKGIYIATEFVQGISLRQFLEKRALSTKKALEIILQVAYALCHLHFHKIIHRDLKPENILITETGEIKVIDFGIAQLKNEHSENEHLANEHLANEHLENDQESIIDTKKQKVKINKTNALIGTPVYMSPEQKNNPAKVSFQTDIYSLGIITYELVLGKLAHGKVSLSLLPEKLGSIISKSLSSDLSTRYQNIVDFTTDLSEYIKNISERHLQVKENIGELISSFDQTKAILLPKEFDHSNRIELSLLEKKGKTNCGFYLDYFNLYDNRCLILFAESIKGGIKSINYTFNLRGIVQASIHHFYSKTNKNERLAPFLLSLNSILSKDPAKQTFALSALLLSLEKNELVFSSLGHENIIVADEETKKITTLCSYNPFLGTKFDSVSETAAGWQNSERIILSSLEASRNFKKQNLTPLKKIISDNLIFPAKIMNEQIAKLLQTGKEIQKNSPSRMDPSEMKPSWMEPLGTASSQVYLKRKAVVITAMRKKM